MSVLCLSYNHEKYIRQCLDSILVQKTSFDVEILIHDDASTDKTREIIGEYVDKHPGRIKPILQSINRYSIGERNLMMRYLFPLSEGKYLAICEGDDYWTDENKLQKQIEFLENYLDHTICFHPVKVVNELTEKKQDDDVFPTRTTNFTTKELLEKNFIQTNSVVFRKLSYENWPLEAMPGDWYMNLYHAKFGKIGFIDNIMSAYRKHDAGMWQNNSDVWKKYGVNRLIMFNALEKLYDKPEERAVISVNRYKAIENILYHSSSQEISSIDDLLKNYGKDIRRYVEKNQTYRTDLKISLRNYDEMYNNLHHELKKKNDKIRDLKISNRFLEKSRDYRIGKLIMYTPRQIRSNIKKLTSRK